MLKTEKLVLDWRKRQRSKAAVRAFIEQELDKLPPAYSDDLWQHKCELAFQHIFDAYPGEGHSIYAAARLGAGRLVVASPGSVLSSSNTPPD